MVMMARAMATRRRMPPESSEGNLSTVCSSSTKRSASATRRSISSSGDVLFQQAIGDVVVDGERVEEGAFLEDHADAAAEIEAALPRGMFVDFFAEEQDACRQSGGEVRWRA